jgi:hypothetical protein
MKTFKYWKIYLINIIIWLFLWTLFDTTIEELNITNKHKIIFCLIGAILTILLIHFDKDIY